MRLVKNGMNTERWTRLEQIFTEAAELSERERQGYLERVCGSDTDLRAEAEALLNAEGPAAELFAMLGQHLSTPEVSALPAGGLRAGPYLLEHSIGSGGMGDVFAARRVDDEYAIRVAVKTTRMGLTSEHLVRRFRRERQILASLEHPNIARLIDGGVLENGCPYMVMEFVDGESIDKWIAHKGLAGSAVLPALLPVLRAAEYAHANLVVHCDLKPANILVTADGVPKLLDFGIAKLLRDEESDVTSVALTPRYAAPELRQGQPATVASDVFSLGILMRETCGPLVPPDSDLALIIAKASEADPAARYASVGALRDDVERLLAGHPILARRPSLEYHLQKYVSRHRIAVLASTLAVLVLAASAVYAWNQAAKANRRYNDTRALARTLMFEAHDAVMELQGSTPVQLLLIDRSMQYLERLAADSKGDPAIEAELADSYRRLGELMGNPYRPNLGDTNRAVETIRRGLQLVERGDSEPTLNARMKALQALGEVLVVKDPVAAREALRRAVATQEQAVAKFPSLDNRLEMMATLGSLGDVLKDEEALHTYQESLRSADAALIQDPANTRGLRGRAITLYKVADGANKLKRFDQALDAGKQALAAMSRTDTSLVTMQRLRTMTLQSLSDSLTGLGRPLEGIPYVDEALEGARRLNKADAGNQQHRISLALLERAKGDSLKAAADLEGARACYRRSREWTEQVIAKDPGNEIWKGRLAEVRVLEQGR